MMWWYDGGMHGWGYAFMALGTLLFWGLVIAGIVAAVRYAARGDRSLQPSAGWPTPEQILADRYARGEIDEDDYRERLRTIAAAKT